ncbi:MAG: hypothetical protein R3B96_07625 [Pirellulaceae bacterium]
MFVGASAAGVDRGTRRTAKYGGAYYVVANASGGWATYLMDPKGIDGINRLYTSDEIQIAGEHRFAPNQEHAQGGMSNEAFFAAYGDELLVLNGLDYSVNNHSPGARYMATGRLDDAAYPTFAHSSRLAKEASCPLAFLTLATTRRPEIWWRCRACRICRVSNASRTPIRSKATRGRPTTRTSRWSESEEAAGRATLESLRPAAAPRQRRAENMLYAAQISQSGSSESRRSSPNEIPRQRLAQQADRAESFVQGGSLRIGQLVDRAIR